MLFGVAGLCGRRSLPIGHTSIIFKRNPLGRGLTNRFGVRITEEALASIIEIADGQPFTFEKVILTAKLETLPNAVRMVIEDHVSNQPDSDLTAVLTGRKSFPGSVGLPAGPDEAGHS